jgi:molybdenum cofactor synthesis domain-containing protein
MDIMEKIVKIEEAVGLVLGHDITEIRKGEFKGRAFKKGHKIKEADICHLQRLGKEHIFVLNIEEGYLHENDAAVTMSEAFCGSGVIPQGDPVEGKVKLVAQKDGLLKVDVEALTQVNMIGEIMCASRHNNTVVNKDETIAATRAIPLVIHKELVEKAVAISRATDGLFCVTALRKAKVGIIITGSEIFNGLIEDQFEAVLRKKIIEMGSEVLSVGFAPDDANLIGNEIKRLLRTGADLILTTGGMSVDPDDVTRRGIEQAGGERLNYGAPVLPGSMFMIGYINEVPLMGVPACGIYHETTIFDLVLPRVLAGEKLGREELARMGHGGLCLNCVNCDYPVCPFGRS